LNSVFLLFNFEKNVDKEKLNKIQSRHRKENV